jgi:hypothetical protein
MIKNFIFLFTLLFLWLNLTAEINIPKLIIDLKDDDIKGNANKAHAQIKSVTNILKPVLFTEPLLKAIHSEDLQQRQLAANILTDYYLKTDLPEKKWPLQLCRVLIEGLRNDEIRGHNGLISNAYENFKILFKMNQLELLKKEFVSGDHQSKFLSAMILSKLQKNSIQKQLSLYLYEQLKDDDYIHNSISAYYALTNLGKGNFEWLVKEKQNLDWQQSAYFEVLANFFQTDWHMDKKYINNWLKHNQRITAGALYLHPEFDTSKHQLKTKAKPLFRLAKNVPFSEKRFNWLSTYLGYINPKSMTDFDNSIIHLAYIYVYSFPHN